MKLLIDTNILIPLEPTKLADMEANAGDAARLLQLASRAGAVVLIHPRQLDVDLENDRDADRRALRRAQASKYNVLANPPPIKPQLVNLLGSVREGSNDWVDHLLIAAISANACSYLVTEDQHILRKAKRAGLTDRVLTLADAIDVLQNLFDQPVEPPPAVRQVLSYELDTDDPIWDSFRDDYPGFDVWLAKVSKEHRPAFVIDGSPGVAGVAILNKESDLPPDTAGRVLKVCSFKIAPDHSGNRFGELLLKAVFTYAYENRYDWVYVEVLEKHADLIALFDLFGFREAGRKHLNELVLTKPMRPDVAPEELVGLAHNIRFGPRHVDWTCPAYLVPIQPHYEDLLFPDRPREQPLLLSDTRPFGNSLRKAYLCLSPSKQLGPGDILVFYRSQDVRAITAIAVVEDVMRSEDSDAVAAHVARRTVYRFEEIQEMARRRPILAIRFRQAVLLDAPIRLNQLLDADIIGAAPQSIARLKDEGKQWIANLIQSSP